ncbi:MAG: hypothetical protein IPK64_20225 [bacterium]|jgi:hypothetical protein|nr:hypothetical protein [bacterium]
MIRTDIYERIEHERRDAALVVCGHATDTDDARQLLTQPTDGWPYLEAHVCEVAS